MYSLSQKEIVAVSAGLGATGHTVMGGLDLMAGLVMSVAALGCFSGEPDYGAGIMAGVLAVIVFVDSGIHIANAADAA